MNDIQGQLETGVQHLQALLSPLFFLPFWRAVGKSSWFQLCSCVQATDLIGFPVQGQRVSLDSQEALMAHLLSPWFSPQSHVGIPSPFQSEILIYWSLLVQSFPHFLSNGVCWFSPHWGWLVVCMGTSLGQPTVTCFAYCRCVKVYMFVCLILCK